MNKRENRTIVTRAGVGKRRYRLWARRTVTWAHVPNATKRKLFKIDFCRVGGYAYLEQRSHQLACVCCCALARTYPSIFGDTKSCAVYLCLGNNKGILYSKEQDVHDAVEFPPPSNDEGFLYTSFSSLIVLRTLMGGVASRTESIGLEQHQEFYKSVAEYHTRTNDKCVHVRRLPSL